MLKLGKVKWFGTYNSIYDDYNDYGFIKPLDPDTGKDIYVHEDDIAPDSNFLKYHPEGCLVVYEESVKKNKAAAVNVRLLKELNKEEKRTLYQCNPDAENITKLIRREYPNIFEDEPLSFFIPYLQELLMRRIFLKKCREMDHKELKEWLKDHNEKRVFDTLRCEYPEFFADEPLSFFLLYLDESPMKDVFLNKCKEMECNELKEWLKGHNEEPVFDILRCEYPGLFADEPLSFFLPYLDESPMNDIFLEKCRKMDHKELKEWLKDYSQEGSVFDILRCGYPELFADEPFSFFLPYLDESPMKKTFLKKCIEMDQNMLRESLKDNLYDERVLKVLLLALPKLYLSSIADTLTSSSVQELHPAWEKAYDQVKQQIMSKLFSFISWDKLINGNKEDCEIQYYLAILSHLEADVYPYAALKIAETMREQNVVFDLRLWSRLRESMKVRILIYCSNFRCEFNNWLQPLRDVYVWEKANGKDKLALIAVTFFSNCYPANPQSNFMSAHEELMKYIAECFSKGLDVTHGLNVLLNRCRSTHLSQTEEFHKGAGYFCDARVWQRIESIYCPEGPDRPEGGRKRCSCFQGMDLSQPVVKVHYLNQRFSEFLLNIGFMPDLSSIDIKNVFEYPYRIAAYVNRLLDMRKHLVCSKCGAHAYPNFKYSKDIATKLSLDLFYCPESKKQPSVKHDSGVYLNYCAKCKKIIDSRECLWQEGGPKPSTGEYLCMYCGATEHIESGTQCPKCGTKQKDLLSIVGKRIICKNCNHDGRYFKSYFEYNFKNIDDTFTPVDSDTLF